MDSDLHDTGSPQFVVAIGTLESLAERHNKSIVRSHAMSHFRKQQRSGRMLRGSRCKPPEPTVNEAAKAQDTTRLHQLLASKDVKNLDLDDKDLERDIKIMRKAWLAWVTTASSTPSSLGNQLDPFSSLPVRMDREMTALKTHCIRFLKATRPWYQVAIQSEVCFISSLFAAAAHANACLGIERSRRCLALKGKSIQLIQRDLRGNHTDPDPGLIRAVLTVASYSNAQGNFTETQNHLLGLEKLVDAGGGLQSLGMGGVLRVLCILHNLQFAALCDVPLPSQLQGAAEPTLPTSLSTRQTPFESPLAMTSGFTTLETTRRCSTRTLNMLSFIQILTRLLLEGGRTASITQSMNSPEAQAVLQTMHQTDETSLIDESCRLAGLIFTAAFVQRTPFAAIDRSQELVQRLHRVIQHTDYGNQWAQPLAGTLLWVYLVGGAASVAAPERPFFVTNLVGLGIAIAPINWPELHSCMTSFVTVQEHLRSGAFR